MTASSAGKRPKAENPFSIGDRVTFRPGPRAKNFVAGAVSEVDDKALAGNGASGVFLVVVCDDGRIRRVRPGAASRAAA